MRGTGAERPVRAMKSGKLDGAKGSRHPACPDGQPRVREEPSSHAKPFNISKWVVWEAYTRVKENHGAAGVDAESVEMFEQDLKSNLYRIWNRMSSGTYFPPPVRSVGIPKKDGSERRLGIPTVADRIAQTVVKMYLEPEVEPQFHSEVRDRRTQDRPAAIRMGIARGSPRSTHSGPPGSDAGVIKECISLMTLCSNVAQAGFLKEPAQSWWAFAAKTADGSGRSA